MTEIKKNSFLKTMTGVFIINLMMMAAVFSYHYWQTNKNRFEVLPWTLLGSFGDFEKEERANIKKPRGITKDEENNIYVVDTGQGVIKVYNEQGKFVKDIGQNNQDSENILMPVDIAYYKGNIYITEPGSIKPRIAVFDKNGKFIKNLITNNEDNKIVPVGIDIADDKIYVTDIFNQQVVILNNKGEIIDRFGEPGKGRGQFAYPNEILVTKDKIYVADTNNGRIQVFGKKTHNFLNVLPIETSQTKLGLPIGLGYYNNKLFVVDALLNNINIFDEKGGRIKVFGTEGVEEGQLLYPSNILLFNRKMYITNTYNNRVEIFSVE